MKVQVLSAYRLESSQSGRIRARNSAASKLRARDPPMFRRVYGAAAAQLIQG